MSHQGIGTIAGETAIVCEMLHTLPASPHSKKTRRVSFAGGFSVPMRIAVWRTYPRRLRN